MGQAVGGFLGAQLSSIRPWGGGQQQKISQQVSLDQMYLY